MNTMDEELRFLAGDADPDLADRPAPVAIRLVAPPRRRRNPILAGAVAAVILGQAALGAPGDLDPSYGDLGRTVISGNNYYSAWSVEPLADGSSVFGGGDEFCDYYYAGCYVAGNFGRLVDVGTVDVSFAPGFLAGTRLTDLTVQADQKIVGVGVRANAPQNGLLVFRTLPDGTLDPAFAGGGQQVLAEPPGEGQLAGSVVIDDQQRIVIAGTRGGKLLVVRLLTDGTLDLGFGSGGVFVGDSASGYGAMPRILTAAGGYRVVFNGDACKVLALTTAGTVDAAYGDAGYAAPPSAAPNGCTTATAQGDGKLVVGGSVDNAAAVWRLQAGGLVDGSFDSSALGAQMAAVTALTIGPGGKILVAGRPLGNARPAVLTRLQPGGALDGTYGNAGLAQFDLHSDYGSDPYVRDMKVQSGGRVLVSGGDMLGRPFVARLLADGEAGPGILGIADRVVGVSEQNGHATVTVQRLGGSHGAVSVAYLTSDENSGTTATPGSDFTAVSGRLDWADGDVSDRQITIPIVADSSSFESDETFTLRLRDPQGGAGLGTEKTDIVIRGDGYVGGVFTTQATATSVQENDSTVRFIVHRNVGSQGAVSVTATVTGVSATAGVDFTAPTPVTLAWADGDAADKFVDVRILDDHKHEDAERFTFALSNATGGAVINATPLSVTIVDEDQKGGGAFGAFGALLLGLAGAVRARRRRG